ncbi:hypothetical protein AB0F88_16765 [Streptosporangium sp. NPDC023963]|uniref:hypothetical protein n=1 Tax=Streptosporangium sp. NPDC023963 TaxID=3155608 RepID=UPI0034182235
MGDVEQHVCVARYCGRLIPAHWVMCPQDWARLPPELQAELPRAYQERRQWWSRYVRVVGAARDVVDEAMGRVVACGPAGEAASLGERARHLREQLAPARATDRQNFILNDAKYDPLGGTP